MARRDPGTPDQATQVALDRMMEAFRMLDHSQRQLRGMVESFRAYLPERAARSGLVPRFEVLDQQAEQLMLEYLATLDQHPIDDAVDTRRAHAARQAYDTTGPKLATHAEAMDQVVLDYDAELTRIGEQARRSRELKEQAAAHTRRVADAVAALRESGLQIPELNGLLGRTRTAAAAANEWEPAVGLPRLQSLVAELDAVAAQTETLAREYPERVSKARNRRSSLRTVVQAVESRLERGLADLAVLRREYSLGNWRDIDAIERTVEEELVSVREKLAEFDRLVGRGAGGSGDSGDSDQVDWSRPLQLLEEVRGLLDHAEEWVDAPGDRLRRLGELKDDPEQLMKHLRFRLRDAQLLVTHNPRRGGDAVGKQLDTLAVRIDGIRTSLRGAHPDYWGAVQEGERIEQAVKGQVERFRALPV